MKKNDKRQLDDNFIEQKIADAFGYTDEKLAAELDKFMEEAAGERGQRPPEAPEEEFRKILDIVEREKDSQKKNGLRVRRLIKVMAAVAVLGSMVLGGGMWVGARKTRVYEEQKRTDLDNVIVFDNNDDNLIDDTEIEVEEAYEQIRKELDIPVMELSYLPKGMSFYQLVIKEGKSVLAFFYKEHAFLFYQGVNQNTSSFSFVSDTEELKSVYNTFLDSEILIYKEILENGSIEFSARVVKSNNYYILEGAIEEDEFEKVVLGLKFYDD
ncbi:MAG: DUF4367 domain-containing protein [Hungatella sp.]|nr:DUF4367 domain-containing protein [Hungatella sp.]